LKRDFNAWSRFQLRYGKGRMRGIFWRIIDNGNEDRRGAKKKGGLTNEKRAGRKGNGGGVGGGGGDVDAVTSLQVCCHVA